MLNFDTYGGNVGQFRVHTPLEEVHTNNLSQIHEVYQNLPQLSEVIFPKAEHRNSISREDLRLEQSRYPEPYHSDSRLNEIDYYHNMIGPSRGAFRRRPSGGINKRDGWGWDLGWGGDSGYHHKDSPALSALALLGFMFFLNLIQTSLQNNRTLLAAKALNATTVGILGRSDWYPRFRRDLSSLEDVSVISAEGPSQNEINSGAMTVESPIEYEQIKPHIPPSKPPSYTVKGPVPMKPFRRTSSKFMGNNHHISFVGPQNHLQLKLGGTNSNITTTSTNQVPQDPIESFKSMSLQCFQLVACKLGKSIFDNLDGTTGVVVRMLGTSLIPRIPRKSWTGRLMRAFNKGWHKSTECEHLFKKCEALSKLLNFYTSNPIPSLRRKKSVGYNKRTHY